MLRATPICLLLLAAAPAHAASGQTSAYVSKVSFEKTLPAVVFKIGNTSSQTTSDARDIRVLGSPQPLSVSGSVQCQQGAQAAGAEFYQARAYVSAASTPNYHLVTLAQPSATADLPQTRRIEAVQMVVPVDYQDGVGNSLINLGLAPAALFEQRLANHVAKGGSAADYLRQTQAFESAMSVTLVGYCFRQGEPRLHLGTAPAEVKLIILYDGDLRIQDGIGPRAGAKGLKAPAGPRVRR